MTEENKSVKNFPNLRFSGFEGNWEMIRLGELTKLITKGTTPKKFVSEGVKFIKIECFEGNIINSEKCLYIDEKVHHKELRRSILEENDLLFAIAGATIGKINIITKEILPANTNQALAIIRLNTNENINFIYQILKSDIMQKYIKDSISVGAQPNLNLQQMNDFSFHHPSLSEQNKISSFLISIDERISTQKKIIEKSESLMEQSREDIFLQKIRFKEDNFPKWEQRKLRDILFESNEKSIQNNQYRVISSTTKGLFYQDEYFTRDIASQDNTGYKILKKGQLVFSPQNLWLGNINVNINFEIGLVSPSYKIFDFNTNLTTYSFCNFFLKTSLMLYEYTQSSIQGASVVRRNLDLNMFLNIKILLPSIKEQIKIANFLSSIQKKIETEKQILEKLELQKKFLLANLFV